MSKRTTKSHDFQHAYKMFKIPHGVTRFMIWTAHTQVIRAILYAYNYNRFACGCTPLLQNVLKSSYAIWVWWIHILFRRQGLCGRLKNVCMSATVRGLYTIKYKDVNRKMRLAVFNLELIVLRMNEQVTLEVKIIYFKFYFISTTFTLCV